MNEKCYQNIGWPLPHEQQNNPLQRGGCGVLARAEDICDGGGHILLIQCDPGRAGHTAVQRHDKRVCYVPDDARLHGLPVLHNFGQDEFIELCVEFLELIKQCFDGVGKELEPRHNVHNAASAHRLCELVVTPHHLLKLGVVVRIAFPEAQGAENVCHGHHKVLVWLKVAMRARFAHEQPDQLFEFTHDVVLDSVLSVRVTRGEFAHGGMGHPSVHLPPFAVISESHATPGRDETERGEIRSAGEIHTLLHERLSDRVAVKHYHGTVAKFDLKHVAVVLRHARKVDVRVAPDLRRITDDRPRKRPW